MRKRPKLTAGCCVAQAAGTVDEEAGDFIRTLMGTTIITAKTIKMPDEKQLRSWTAARQREFWVCRRNFWGKQRLHHLQKQCAQQGLSAEGHKEVSFHDIAVIWVAFFSRRQRYRCQQDLVTRIACAEFHAGLQDHDYAGAEGGELACNRSRKAEGVAHTTVRDGQGFQEASQAMLRRSPPRVPASPPSPARRAWPEASTARTPRAGPTTNTATCSSSWRRRVQATGSGRR